MNKLQIAESEGNRLLKLSNEPAIKALSSEWDTHKISWLPSFATSRYVFGDTVIHTRQEYGVPVTTKEYLGFSNVKQLLGYFKTTYGEANPIYVHAKEFFSEVD